MCVLCIQLMVHRSYHPCNRNCLDPEIWTLQFSPRRATCALKSHILFVVLKDTTSPIYTTPVGNWIVPGRRRVFRPGVYKPAVVAVVELIKCGHTSGRGQHFLCKRTTSPALCHANITIIIVITCPTTGDAFWILVI